MFGSSKRALLATVLSLVGLTAGALVVVALTAQIADQIVRGGFAPERYFSYFSIQTSIANAAFLITSGIRGFRGSSESPVFAAIRACLVTYAVMTAVVYELLLRGGVEQLHGNEALLDWPIEATHVWIPVYFVIDWIIRADRPRLTVKVAIFGAVYPVAWFVLSLGRGALTGWYPYDFMNPTLPGGFAAIAVAVALIGALYLVCMSVVLGTNRLHHRSR